MPVLTFPKSTLGPVIEVIASPSAEGQRQLSQNGKALPKPARLRMLIDTGADQTAIDENLVAHWGLAYVSAAFIGTMAGTRPVRRYEVALTLQGVSEGSGWTLDPITVIARHDPFAGRPYAGLLGRDVLDRAVFVCDGPGHSCSLTF